ncbi:MAG: hypothetical protein AB1Z98_02480 [Nannocystaceae bacterium]
MLCTLLIASGLTLALAPSAHAEPAAARSPRAVRQVQPVDAVLLRPQGVDPAVLLDALQLRSPERALVVPPWPTEPGQRFELFAVSTVRHEGTMLELTVVLSDGRAYYRTLEADAAGAPRLAASTIANLLAAIEEDALPPDEEDVPLPVEQEPEPESAAQPEPELVEPAAEVGAQPPGEPERRLEPAPAPPLELEPIAAATLGFGLGPPSPSGFAGGGGTVGAELRWPAGPVLSLSVRSHWHRPAPLVVGSTRVSVGGGNAWRRGRVELRTVLALDVEPWGARRGGTRQEVAYPDGQRRELGLQLGGHLRLVPSLRIPLGARHALRVGPRLEIAASSLAQAPGVARLFVVDEPQPVARVGGLELSAGFELGLAWSLPSGTPKDAGGAP